MQLEAALERRGWTATGLFEFRKGGWQAWIDTGSWLQARVNGNLCLSDIEIHDAHHDEPLANWTVSLIEHLCGLQDDRLRLWRALERIRDAPDPTTSRTIAVAALDAPRATALDLGGRHVRKAIVEEQAGMTAEIARLTAALEAIRDASEATAVRAAAATALATCHHNWLYQRDSPDEQARYDCPICGAHRRGA